MCRCRVQEVLTWLDKCRDVIGDNWTEEQLKEYVWNTLQSGVVSWRGLWEVAEPVGVGRVAEGVRMEHAAVGSGEWAGPVGGGGACESGRSSWRSTSGTRCSREW